jgi:hypothetical protein
MEIGTKIKEVRDAIVKGTQHTLRDEPVRHLLNSKLGRYGEMLKLEIDSKQKTISLEILPRGEDKPIQVTIGRYEVVEGAQGGFKLGDIQASREWITEILKTLVPEPTVPLGSVTLLKLIM